MTCLERPRGRGKPQSTGLLSLQTPQSLVSLKTRCLLINANGAVMSFCVCEHQPLCPQVMHLGVMVSYEQSEKHPACHCPPPPGTDTPVGLSFKDTHLHCQTSKSPLREQFSARASFSCDLWSMGVAPLGPP